MCFGLKFEFVRFLLVSDQIGPVGKPVPDPAGSVRPVSIKNPGLRWSAGPLVFNVPGLAPHQVPGGTCQA
jgi:hypothetical protein